MNPPNGIPTGSVLTPQTGPVAQPPAPQPTVPAQLPVVPQYNLLEGRAGLSLTPGESPQFQLGLVLQLHHHVRGGLTYSTNFGDAHQFLAHVGPSFRINDFMRLNIPALGGFGFLDDSASRQGRLQENVLRNGVQGFFGLGVEIEARVARNVAFYAQASVLRVFNGGLVSTPAAVSTNDALNPDGFQFGINFGLSIGGIARPRGNQAETNAPTQRPGDGSQNGGTGPTRDDSAERIRSVEEALNRQVAALRTSFTEQIEARNRAQVDGAINSVQSSINALTTRITQLSGGINEVNRLLSVITRLPENFPSANSPLSIEHRTSFTQALDQLEAALRNSGTNPRLNAQLQSAFLYIPNASLSHSRLIQSFINSLGTTEAEAVLRGHGETVLADRVHSIREQCIAYARSHPNAIMVQHMQQDVAAMEASFTTLEGLVGSHLQQDPRWTNLRSALSEARDRVNMNYRTTLAYNQFTQLLSSGGHYFRPLTANPALARSSFDQVVQYARNVGNQEDTRGVTLAGITQQFGPFTETLLHNLNYFIYVHTQPQMTSRTELRRWLPAVQAAHNLACQFDAASAACRAPVTGTAATTPTTPTAPPPSNASNANRDAANVATRLRSVQRQVDDQARTAHGDAVTTRRAFNALASAQRSNNIEVLVQAVEAADTAASAAAAAARAPGATLEVATEQLAIARTQAGIARSKMNEANTAIAAAAAPAQPTQPPPPPPPTVPPPVAAVEDAGAPSTTRPTQSPDAGNENAQGRSGSRAAQGSALEMK